MAIIAVARPLLFTSIDQAVATARGVPVRVLSVAFLGLVGICAAEATQAIGALLLLGLLAAPAGAAQRLTHRPYLAFWLSGTLAIISVWIGITISYLVANVPPSFAIMATATTIYLGAFIVSAIRRRDNTADLSV